MGWVNTRHLVYGTPSARSAVAREARFPIELDMNKDSVVFLSKILVLVGEILRGLLVLIELSKKHLTGTGAKKANLTTLSGGPSPDNIIPKGS